MNSAKAFRLVFYVALLGLIVGCIPAANPGSAPDGKITPALNQQTPIPERASISNPVVVLETPPTVPYPTLAYLRQGDLWFFDFSTNRELQVATAGNIQAFAWSPDGQLVAAYTVEELCIISASAGTTLACILLEPPQRPIYKPASLNWSPDQKQILVMQDEWWLVDVAAGQPVRAKHIVDPQNWGATWSDVNDPNSPAFTGQGLFLADGSLIGTSTHLWDCGSGGCSHRLFRFNDETLRFDPFGGSNFTNGGEQLVLSDDGRLLVNYGSFHVGCGMYTTYVNIADLTTGDSRSFAFEQESFYELALSPDGNRFIIAQGTGCGSSGQDVWSVSCGLFESFEIYPLQLWDWQANTRETLVPGLEPDWSDDRKHLVFRSCLAQAPDGQWKPIESGPPWLYVLSFGEGGYTIQPVAIGQSPSWQP